MRSTTAQNDNPQIQWQKDTLKRSSESPTACNGIRWKRDTYPASGRPQGVINEQALDASDILVAVFRSRFGSPTGCADSGTEEEIRRSIADGRAVMLYFHEPEADMTEADAEQLRQLVRFKEEMRRSALVHSYGDPQEFKRAFAVHLPMAVNALLKQQRSDHIGPRIAAPPPQSAQNVIEFSGGHNVGNVIHQTVVHKYTGKRKPPAGPPEGSIGADLHKRNYCRYLTKRYNEYREADSSYGRQTRFSYGFISKRVEHTFGNPINMNPAESFEAICDFLKGYIDQTIQGKRNRSRGAPNYKSFDEFLAEQEVKAQRGAKRKRKPPQD